MAKPKIAEGENLHPLQKFEFGRVHRSKLLNAPYNPRTISERNNKALGLSIQKNGLILPLVWNKQTGNIVGGHQRLGRLDSSSRSKDYELDVAIVDMSEREEIAANIALNNQSTMGEFDIDAIKGLAEQFDLKLDTDLLFDRDDLLVSFGLDLDEAKVQVQNANTDPEALQAIRDRKKVVREAYKNDNKQTTGHFNDKPVGTLNLVFRDEDQKQAFCRKAQIQENAQIIHAEEILDLGELPPPDPNAPVGLSFVLSPEENAEWLRLMKELACSDNKQLLLRLCRDVNT